MIVQIAGHALVALTFLYVAAIAADALPWWGLPATCLAAGLIGGAALLAPKPNEEIQCSGK